MQDRKWPTNRGRIFVVAAAAQIAIGIVFLAAELSEHGASQWERFGEVMALLGLLIGAAVTIREVLRLRQRNRAVERQLDAATGAFVEVMEQSFDDWGLTPSERDVALLSVKGLSIAEIARLRNTKEGTIKAQNAAVYRKAGVSGRAELLSLFIEELVDGIALPEGMVDDRGAA